MLLLLELSWERRHPKHLSVGPLNWTSVSPPTKQNIHAYLHSQSWLGIRATWESGVPILGPFPWSSEWRRWAQHLTVFEQLCHGDSSYKGRSINHGFRTITTSCFVHDWEVSQNVGLSVLKIGKFQIHRDMLVILMVPDDHSAFRLEFAMNVQWQPDKINPCPWEQLKLQCLVSKESKVR